MKEPEIYVLLLRKPHIVLIFSEIVCMTTRRTALALIIVFAVLPLTVGAVVFIILASKGHESLIEGKLEELTGLSADVRGIQSIEINRFRIHEISVGEGLFSVEGAELDCELNPFRITHLRIDRFRFDCGGANSGKFLRMLEFIQNSRNSIETGGAFTVEIMNFSACVPVMGTFPPRLEAVFGGPVTIESDDGMTSTITFENAGVFNGKEPLSGKAEYNVTSRSGRVFFRGNMDIINRFLTSYVNFTENPVEGQTRFSRNESGELTLSLIVEDRKNGNRYEGEFRFPSSGRKIYVDAFRTNLRKSGAVMTFFPQSEYVTLSGGELMARGSVTYLDNNPGFSISWYVDIDKPVISFNKDIDAGTRLFRLSEVKPYYAGSFTSKSEFTIVNPQRDVYTVSVHSATGTMENGNVFWDVKGDVNIRGDDVDSDITAYLYEIPLSSIRGFFTALGLNHSWIEVAEGPIDCYVKNFDISHPSAAPLTVSSGSRGLDFWISDSLPRMEGIFIDDLKIYLPDGSGNENKDMLQ